MEKKSKKGGTRTKDKSTVEVKLPNIMKLAVGLLVFLVILSVINVFLVFDVNKFIENRRKIEEEAMRPANIEITKIVFSSCTDCYDIDQEVQSVKQLNVEVIDEKNLELNSPEAKELIDTYQIKRIPSFIIKGETTKSNVKDSWLQMGEIKEDGTVVFTKKIAPYYDVSKDRIVGLVSITNIVDSSCKGCVNLDSIIGVFKQVGVKFSEEKKIEYTSDDAASMIEKYGINEIPAIVISEDIVEYEALQQAWGQLGAEKRDGFFILHATQPPYRNLSTDEIVGLVELVNIVDETCDTCYNVSLHKQILPRFGVKTIKEETYDVSSEKGQKLLNEYNITKVPTILLSPDAGVYTSLVQVWTNPTRGIGTIEEDGWFVFRNLDAMGVSYKDLASNEIVTP